MTFTQTTLLAARSGIGSGWWIVMVPMMLLMMGGMMWMLMRGMGGGSSQGSSGPSESPAPKETPLEVLERRFAEGEISADDYRARREVLLHGTAAPSDDEKDEPVTATPAGERRR